MLRTRSHLCALSLLLTALAVRVVQAADAVPVTDALAEITVTAEKQLTNLQ
jgi:hypothetical protein